MIRTKIAFVNGYTASREWTKYASQQSTPINLVAGRRYYIEVLHKESTAGDNLAVGRQLPDNFLERPIPGNRLSSYVPGGILRIANESLNGNEKNFSQIVVYPNPFERRTHLKNTVGWNGTATITLFDQLGRTRILSFQKVRQNQEEITVETGTDLPPGLYFISVRSLNEASKTFRVLKQ